MTWNSTLSIPWSRPAVNYHKRRKDRTRKPRISRLEAARRDGYLLGLCNRHWTLKEYYSTLEWSEWRAGHGEGYAEYNRLKEKEAMQPYLEASRPVPSRQSNRIES